MYKRQANILALAEVYGMASGTVDANFVSELVGAIKADILSLIHISEPTRPY